MGIRTFLMSNRADRRLKIKKYIALRKYKHSVSVHFPMKMATEIYYHRHKKDCIIIDGWLVAFHKNKVADKKRVSGNWGDDINIWFFERITGKIVIPAKMLFLSRHRKKICAIGSVVPQDINSQTTIWGSGWCGEKEMVFKKPLKILAVRGPLTRDYFINHGVDCPAIYGDPALLLPHFYHPQKTNQKKIGIIPHHRDWDFFDKQTIEKYQKNTILINLTQYECWTDIIDLINSCDLILSSSLHGMIVSDAYGIPNVFVEFTFHHSNWIKYKDYCLSVNKTFFEPIQYNESLDLNILRAQAQAQLSQLCIDTTALEKACPFILNNKFSVLK